MSTPPPYEWAIVLAGLIGITTAISVVLSRGALAAGFSRSTATAVAWAVGIGWASWALTSAALAGNDVYLFEPTRKLPWLPVAMIVPLLVVALLGRRAPVVSRILARPDALWRLTVPQTFRLVGVAFLVAMALGRLPAVFALPAGLGDIAIGVEAFVIARNLRRGVIGPSTVWFNILGIIDLAFAFVVGFIAAPGALHLLIVSPTTQAISQLPLALIPTTVVPLALACHVLSLRNLRRLRKLRMEQRSRVVLVSGVSSGIGLAVARAFAAKGFEVLGTSRTPHTTDPIPGVELVQLDVTDAASVTRGRLDGHRACGSHRHPGQQRRVWRHRRRGGKFGHPGAAALRHQFLRLGADDPRGAAVYAGAGQRSDHQHQLGAGIPTGALRRVVRGLKARSRGLLGISRP